ncbi:MAG: [FeFe] hydrogenase H-cluster radical SAM maturase HydE [Kiritimatiellae bacterium]|nr:[FeFe] hydrogenase H-cluster radical SAM maturase HydE [Kiritimatiellia bacterium]
MEKILSKAVDSPRALSHSELIRLLESEDQKALFDAAYKVKAREVGGKVSLRGLIECGNLCAKDCLYCGIRKGNGNVRRYRMDAQEIVRQAEISKNCGYGNIVLQSGEIESEENTQFFENVLREIHDRFGDDFGVTLSLGEQTDDTYRRWKAAGAHRYLLRIETSNPELYAKLHPDGHSWLRRRDCIRSLRGNGYQVGSGVMCGLPGQTFADLASDIMFFGEEDIDMIGMGPYIPHPQTPLGQSVRWTPELAQRQFRLGLGMIAATRLYLHDVNIAASTALHALDPDGREKGLLAGANVIMPNITDVKYRPDYLLYEGKPMDDENIAAAREKLDRAILNLGEEINWNMRGDSPHWRRR